MALPAAVLASGPQRPSLRSPCLVTSFIRSGPDRGPGSPAEAGPKAGSLSPGQVWPHSCRGPAARSHPDPSPLPSLPPLQPCATAGALRQEGPCLFALLGAAAVCCGTDTYSKFSGPRRVWRFRGAGDGPQCSGGTPLGTRSLCPPEAGLRPQAQGGVVLNPPGRARGDFSSCCHHSPAGGWGSPRVAPGLLEAGRTPAATSCFLPVHLPQPDHLHGQRGCVL